MTTPLLPRYTHPHQPADPLELELAAKHAREHAARQAIAAGAPPTDPASLRGIPCIARGVGGTSPGTNPATHVLALDRLRTIRPNRYRP